MPERIVVGSHVTLSTGVFSDSRSHLQAHAARGDIGTVVEGRRAAYSGWIHVQFEECGMAHRLIAGEIALAGREPRVADAHSTAPVEDDA